MGMPKFTDALAHTIESLLCTIPERWSVFDNDNLTATEQQALFLLTAAGLVDRRFGLCLKMAGQPVAVEARFSATGEYGLVEAIEPILTEVWTK